MNLKDKIVVVLGANGGIGSCVIDELKKDGAKVIPLTRKEVDLTNIKGSYKAGLSLVKDFPKIDAIINATGVGIYRSLNDLSEDEWERSMNINVAGPLFFIKSVLPALNKEDSVVVNIGSGLGKKPYYKERIPYIASKFSLRGVSLALSKDFEGQKPDFCLVTLGSIMTKFGPGGMEKRKKLQEKGKVYFDPEWAAERIIYVLKDKERQTEYTFYPKDYIKKPVSG